MVGPLNRIILRLSVLVEFRKSTSLYFNYYLLKVLTRGETELLIMVLKSGGTEPELTIIVLKFGPTANSPGVVTTQ